MSKERRRQHYDAKIYEVPEQPIPVEPTVCDEANTVVLEHESRILNALSLLYLRFRAMGQERQAAIAQGESVTEIYRQTPGKDKWACENGDSKPEKGPVNWGDL